jgi:hypothetical protein
MQKKIEEYWGYDPATGRVYWHRDYYRFKKGQDVGTPDKGKYLKAQFDGQMLYLHRVAWRLHYGTWPPRHIDHVNADGLDNRIDNLRLATPSENSCNRRIQSNNNSGFKGVSFKLSHKKWSATIWKQSKKIHIGYFDTPEEASEAYKTAAKWYHGEFARW